MHKVIISLVFCLLSLVATAQNNVSNIRIEQMENVLIILYDLNIRADIELHASFDGGITFTGPLKKVIGAVGRGINPEVDKVIAWNVLAEIGEIDNLNTVIKIVSLGVGQNLSRQQSLTGWQHEMQREKTNRMLEEEKRRRQHQHRR